jgi:hypothetical protein
MAERAEREARAALEDLSRFLAEHGATLQTIDAAGLNELERGYMREVRRHVPCALLIGVPRGVERKWLAFARLYCAYLLASGARGPLDVPCLVLVSVPGKSELEPCVLWTRGLRGRHGLHGLHSLHGRHGRRAVLRRVR